MSPSSRRTVPITNLSSDGVEDSSKMSLNSSKRSTLLSGEYFPFTLTIPHIFSPDRGVTNVTAPEASWWKYVRKPMSDYVPPLSTPHIIKYYLRALLGSVERTCGYIAFDVSIVIPTSNV